MYDVLDIANKIIWWIKNQPGDDCVSNLRLQHLLFYQQAFHLLRFDKPLFENEMELWLSGAGIVDVWTYFHIACELTCEEGLECTKDIITLDEKDEMLFNEVMEEYCKYSTIGLIDLFNRMSRDYRIAKCTPALDMGFNEIIPKDVMCNMIKNKIKDENK